MSQSLTISNIAEKVGEAAKQGANNALQNQATNDLVQTAISGAHSGINQLTSTVSFSTQVAPINFTSTSAANSVTFGANGNPVSSPTLTGPRDSNNRLYVLSTPSLGTVNLVNYNPPGGNDNANAIALQLAAENPVQDAILYGPEALRQRAVIPLAVTIPIDTASIAKGIDDGIKPQADPAPTIYGARVEREDSGGWPAGRRIEDRSQYGPQGDLARDTIPASVVYAIVGDNPTGTVGWFVRIAIAITLLILILYIIKQVINESQKKKSMQDVDNMQESSTNFE